MHELTHALGATWSPFVLVAGLLLIGHVAAEEGLFRVVGWWCSRIPGGGVATFLATMAAVAVVTAVLNLDTSVVFMTPVAVHAARAKGTDVTAFCYGTIFMSNAASLLLLGSNLTNLLVFAERGATGSGFAGRMAGPWAVSIASTALVVVIWRWSALRQVTRAEEVERERVRVGAGAVAVALAVVAMLVVPDPALVVFAVGLSVELVALARGGGTWRAALRATSPLTLGALFLVAVAVGWFARASSATSSLLVHGSAVVTALTAGLTAVVINNLPAASLFAAHHVARPYALLIGLDLGPNIAVTGALSSLLWIRLARREGLRPSIVTFSAVGVVAAVAAAAGGLVLLG